MQSQHGLTDKEMNRKKDGYLLRTNDCCCFSFLWYGPVIFFALGSPVFRFFFDLAPLVHPIWIDMFY